MKIFKRVATTIGLCIIDQHIKTVIDRWFTTSRVEIEHIFGFHPKLNTQQLSIFNNEMGLNFGIGIGSL